ncbi:MAG: hypothetical protein KC502_05775 [Myxococcales bacterium]|nr:hypothetical protein [Myxococcales bacterium]
MVALAALLTTLPATEVEAASALPEVVIAIDSSESMQWSVKDGLAPDCTKKKPAASRWASTLQMLLGTIKKYSCTKDALPAHPDVTTPPAQVVGGETCIGGVTHILAKTYNANLSKKSKKPVGVKKWPTKAPPTTTQTQLRYLTTTTDVAVPYFSFDVTKVPTVDPWVTGALYLVTKDKSTLDTGDIWGFLVKLKTDPATMEGQALLCEALKKARDNAVTAPVKVANTPGKVTQFTLTADHLQTVRKAVLAGTTTFYFAVIPEKAWFNEDCSGRGDDLSEKVDMNFHGPDAPWPLARPRFRIGVGKKCPSEGPGAHFTPVGTHGGDGILSQFSNAAKFSLLTMDNILNKDTSATGGFSYAQPMSSYWGDINLGAADPYGSGTNSVPIPRPDGSVARLNAIAAIKTNLPTIKPVGGTPLAALIQDIAAYFGPSAFQDKHFQTTIVDPINGDPYFECRPRFAVLFTDGGANLHTGATDGRAAAVQAAAALWTTGVALYVVVPGAGGVLQADLDFADEIAAAGGTQQAWRVSTALELSKALKGVLQAAGTSGEVLTPTVYTSSTGSTQDVQHTFNAMSNFDLTEPMQTWGVIEQRFFGCETGCVDAKTPGRAQVCSVTDYGTLLQNRTPPRRLYTQVGGARRDLTSGTISPDDMKISKTGLAPKLTLDGANNCVTLPNTFDLSNPTTRAAYAADVLSQVRGDKGSCRFNRKLGAVARSRPAILGPAAQIALRDPSFRAFANRKIPSSATYSTTVRPGSLGRPTLLFASTHEGVLHAFRTDRDTTISTKDNLKAGGELWAWAPLFNLQRFRQLKLIADADRSFLGGSIVTGHVQLDKLGNSVSELSDRWRSVVLAGAGEAGAGFFALDVTSPEDPRLLWEIGPNHHCFGSGNVGAAKGPKCMLVNTYEGLGRSTASPVIGSAYVKFGGVTMVRSVAIIAGGKPPLDSDVQNSGVDGTGERALWIVDMATGALIRKLGNADIDTAGSTVTINDAAKDLGYYWTEPGCYETAPGQIVSRCFLGDSKGMVWRVDLSDIDPQKWKIRFFHDPYSASDTPASLHQGIKGKGRVPVLSPPVMSTDSDGSLVVLYGTGGAADATKLARRHIVYSVKEKLTLAANGVATKIEAEPLWLRVLSESTRYVGPPTIFSRNAYFASYTLSAGGVCSNGTARMWGAHYVRRSSPSDPESIIGAFPNPASTTGAGKALTNLIIGNNSPSPIEITPVPACVAGCAPTDLQCLVKAKTSAGAAGKPTFEANVGTASTTQGKYQKPTSGSQPKVGTITRALATPRSTTVITGWDLLLD